MTKRLTTHPPVGVLLGCELDGGLATEPFISFVETCERRLDVAEFYAYLRRLEPFHRQGLPNCTEVFRPMFGPKETNQRQVRLLNLVKLLKMRA